MSFKPEEPKGSHVGNYELLKTIGEGAFATVKIGIHRLTHQKFAIKIIDKTKFPDEYSMKNIHREAQILRTLDHPNIIKLFEVMETKKNLFLVLEFAQDHIIAKKKLSENEAKVFAKEIMGALVHAHRMNIVHRDLKAENILLDEKMNIKITDFGLSNFFDEKTKLVTCCGSPVYSAPELIEGRNYSGTGVDSWSFGINMYAMVIGDLPFADSNLTALYESISKGKYHMPSFVTSDFISKLLVVNPLNRATISSLLNHNWVSDAINFLDNADQDEVAVKFRPQTEEEIDMNIIEQMELMGLERKSAIAAILTGKFNQSAGIYYSLTFQQLNGIPVEILPKANSEQVLRKENEEMGDELANVLLRFERANVEEEEGIKHFPKKHNESIINKLIIKQLTKPTLPKLVSEPMSLSEFNPPQIHQKAVKKITKGKEKFLPEINKTLSFSGPNTTKYGILQKQNTILEPLAVDHNLYLVEENQEPDQPRTIKFPFNCSCHFPISPKVYFDRLTFILEKNDVIWNPQSFMCDCEWGDIRFETEVCKLPQTDRYGVRIKRRNGDIWEFKKLSAKIVHDLEGVMQS